MLVVKNTFNKKGEMYGISLLVLLLLLLLGCLFFWYQDIDSLFVPSPQTPPYFLKIGSYIVFVCGIFLWVDSVVLLRIYGKGSPHPKYNPTQKIVAKGPYRFLKHPIYIGFILIFFSRAVAVLSPSLLIIGFIVTALLNKIVIPWETKHNRRRFGTKYDDYARDVDSRWMQISTNKSKILGPIFLFTTIVFGVTNLSMFVPICYMPFTEKHFNFEILAITGGLICFVGVVFFISAVVLFFKQGLGLKTFGPYRFVRNPMYAGVFYCHIGGSLLLNSWYGLITTPVLVGIASFYVTQIKERQQLKQYGSEFIIYCKTVNRFFFYRFSKH